MSTVTHSLEQALTFPPTQSEVEDLQYYASEISDKLGYTNTEELEATLSRTFQVFSALHLSAKKNFKQIFRFQKGEMIIDWKLSPLACYLMILNGNPSNPNIGKAQLFFAANSSI